MVEMKIHGANGEAEFGAEILTEVEANARIELMKKADWFCCQGENLRIKEITIYCDESPTVINVFTEMQ